MRLKPQIIQMNMRGNMVAVWILVLLFAVAIVGGGIYLYGKPPSEVTVGAGVQDIIEETTTGDIATVKVYVRDLAQNDINTKKAVAVYCMDEDGFIIDGTSSSTSTEISGQTTRGGNVKCWAFNATYQSLAPVSLYMNKEKKSIVIDAFHVPMNAKVAIYNDQLVTGSGGIVNVTGVGADSTGSMQKIRVTNNNTDFILPFGGLYLDTVTNSNVSTIELAGNGVLSLRGSSFLPSVSSASFTDSDLSTRVSARKDRWDFVFEIDAGNDVLLLEENDYVETGAVRVTGDGDGCATATADDLISMYAFTEGFYRATKSQEVLFGHETDASSSAVITADLTGETFYCTG